MSLFAWECAKSTPNTPHIVISIHADSSIEQAIALFHPNRPIYTLPAWDCLPYDRIGPKAAVSAQRLAAIHGIKNTKEPYTLIVTADSFVQKISPFAQDSVTIKNNQTVQEGTFENTIISMGYRATSLVTDVGEYSKRGGLIDIFPAGYDHPVRLDMFGDEVESIKSFDVTTQMTTDAQAHICILPLRELPNDEASRQLFLSNYRAHVERSVLGDSVYEAVENGLHYEGLEHWMSLYGDLLSLSDILPKDAQYSFETNAIPAMIARQSLIQDFYDARIQSGDGYCPVRPDTMYSMSECWDLPSCEAVNLTVGYNFSAERQNPDTPLIDAVCTHIRNLQKNKKRILITGKTKGSLKHLSDALKESGLLFQKQIELFDSSLPKKTLGLCVLSVSNGIETADLAIITEQDIYGDRSLTKPRKTSKSDNFITEVSALAEGDYVIHADHGVGQYMGLLSLDLVGAKHDVLELHYLGGDKLFLPVENIDVLSPYKAGSDGLIILDKLGSAQWQKRKASVKKRLMDIAQDLIKIAAEREIQKAPVMDIDLEQYDKFCKGFPYVETDDQKRSIEDVLGDITADKPMDRLLCGDVGFGKTEVAMRAAFVAAMSGYQVVVIAPTTLLARQHYETFSKRFKGFPLNVKSLSRFIKAKEQTDTKKGMADGTVDIVIGTHGLFAKGISFKRVGLLIIDEEQSFGVKQKERIKELRSEVHVLTISATPIPRTLQLSMTGVKDLSLITTAPMDRLPVRTVTMPWDDVILREALMREHFRGGQSFVVCPRLKDLDELQERLQKVTPDLKIVKAHGQLSPADLESVMNDFYDRKFDVLVSTNIVESGLDIPTANTMIIHRADMFGLANLYQLRGRVGRSKTRGYAYLTTKPNMILSENARKRLKVMQSLEALGAGFQLASHDMDIRGTGNLVGQAQTGHIKEVGVELYQQLLKEAVEYARNDNAPVEEKWSPQINLGIPVRIPEDYIKDVSVRVGLYRRLGDLQDNQAIDNFGIELVDRFGDYPKDVKNLLALMRLKKMCIDAHVVSIDAGIKGFVVALHNDEFPKPDKLLGWIQKNNKLVNLRADQKIIYKKICSSDEDKIKACISVLSHFLATAKS